MQNQRTSHVSSLRVKGRFALRCSMRVYDLVWCRRRALECVRESASQSFEKSFSRSHFTLEWVDNQYRDFAWGLLLNRIQSKIFFFCAYVSTCQTTRWLARLVTSRRRMIGERGASGFCFIVYDTTSSLRLRIGSAEGQSLRPMTMSLSSPSLAST